MTLTEFLLARIAEADEGCWGCGEYEGCRDQSDLHAREAEANRRIVGLHRRNEVLADLGILIECLEGCIGAYPCETIRALALPYADHPDYDEKWRP